MLLGMKISPITNKKKDINNDIFGKEDEDWDIYRGFNKNYADEDE
jgi:hypothetical protein